MFPGVTLPPSLNHTVPSVKSVGNWVTKLELYFLCEWKCETLYWLMHFWLLHILLLQGKLNCSLSVWTSSSVRLWLYCNFVVLLTTHSHHKKVADYRPNSRFITPWIDPWCHHLSAWKILTEGLDLSMGLGSMTWSLLIETEYWLVLLMKAPTFRLLYFGAFRLSRL